jgi:hypothetical protein
MLPTCAMDRNGTGGGFRHGSASGAEPMCAAYECMAAPALLRPEIRALVFDQYGIVVDM